MDDEGGKVGTAPRAVFRIPLTALVAVAVLTVCVTPTAFATPGLQVVYLLPLGIAAWLLRERTTVDPTAIVARYLVSTRTLSWHELDGLTVGSSGAVRAVTQSGDRVRLPGVRATDLEQLAQASGGAVDVTRRREGPTPT